MNSTSPISPRYSLRSPTQVASELNGAKATSPSRIRMNQIGQRLVSIQSNIEADKINKAEEYEGVIRQLDDQITRDHFAADDRLKHLKDQIVKVQEGIMTEITNRELLDERKTKEIKLVENNIMLEVDSDKQSHREIQDRILQKTDEKVYGLRLDAAKEQKKIDEAVERQTQQIIDQLAGLRQDLEVERRSREENTEVLVSRLEEEINRFEEALDTERKVREETENVLFRMLEDINTKLQSEINKEKKNREVAEEQILTLLEDTCSRIETQLRF